MIRAALLLAALTCSSCVNIAMEIQQPNPAVKPVLSGRDCVDIYFGIGAGTATFENALRRGVSLDINKEWTDHIPIRRIHSASITGSAFLFFATNCLKVTGEP